MPSNPNLKNVYDNSNKVTSTGLSITYRVEYDGGAFWTVTRYAKKQYSFVGMDEATAYECAAAKRSQYLRSFARWYTATNALGLAEIIQNYLQECPSDIAPQHQEGNIWSVDIAVNEEDIKIVTSAPSDLAALFATENARNYDENAGQMAIALNSASRSNSTATISYSQNISGFDANALIAQYQTEGSTAWTTAARVSPASSTSYTVPASGNLTMRLLYGSIQSNVVSVS